MKTKKQLEEKFDEFVLGTFKDGLQVPRTREEWIDFISTLIEQTEDRVSKEELTPEKFEKYKESLLGNLIKQAKEEEREKIEKDLDAIWSKDSINNIEDDGFRDRRDIVIEKFGDALKEQIDYFNNLKELTQ